MLVHDAGPEKIVGAVSDTLPQINVANDLSHSIHLSIQRAARKGAV